MSKEEEWAKLAEAATPGPWTAEEVDEGGFYPGPNCFDVVPVATGGPIEEGGPDVGATDEVDAYFIAAAREAVPALLAEVTRLRAELAATKRALHRAASELTEWEHLHPVPDTEPLGSTPTPCDDCESNGRNCIAHRAGPLGSTEDS